MPKVGASLKYGIPMLVAVFIASAALLYGGAQLVKDDGAAAEEGADAGGEAGGPTTITLVAQNQKWDKSTVSAGADAPVTVIMDNRDPGVLHNVAFYTNRSATQKIFGSELVAGPAQQTSTFTAPPTPGTYFFKCDVHTETMSGTFTVR
jgi:plastocyanin